MSDAAWTTATLSDGTTHLKWRRVVVIVPGDNAAHLYLLSPRDEVSFASFVTVVAVDVDEIKASILKLAGGFN